MTEPEFSLDAHHEGLPEKVEANRQAIINSPSYVLAEKDFCLSQRRSHASGYGCNLSYKKQKCFSSELALKSTVVVFGGTQIVPQEDAEQRLADAKAELAKNPDDHKAQRRVLRSEKRLEKSRFYEECREFAKIVSSTCQVDGHCEYVITTGGGPWHHGSWQPRCV